MADLKALLRRLADELEKEEAGEQSQADKERLDRLEQQVKQAQKAATTTEQQEAILDLDDEEWELIQSHRAGKAAPPEKSPEKPEKPKALKRERLTRQIPRIHSGEDEPDEVEYEDAETGEAKKRPGRKRGVPYEFEVSEEEAA